MTQESGLAPNYRKSGDPRASCQACKHYAADLPGMGMCSRYGHPVESFGVCDRFSLKDEEISLDNPWMINDPGSI